MPNLIDKGKLVSSTGRNVGGSLGKIFSSRISKRIMKAVVTIFFVTTLTFFVVRLMPNNPIDIFIASQMVAYGKTYEEAKNLAASMFAIDFEAPLHEQYLDYMANLLRGNLGKSISATGTPVAEMIVAFLPWTLFSVSLSLFTSFSLGILLGMVTAYKRGTIFDSVLSSFASIISAVPNYLVGIMLIVFLGVQWGVVPIQTMRGSISPGIKPGFTLEFIYDVFFHLAMPFLTYVITTLGGWMLVMKNSTLSTLGEDYVTVAKARGLRDRRITISYIGRNAMLPLFTSLAISLGFIFGGSTLIESIFVYRGIGWLLWSSISSRDYPLMQGIFLILTIAVVVSNLLADLLYSRIDPRVRGGG